MSDLERACQYLDIDPGRVVKHRKDGDEYVVIADYGIGGVKKHRAPLASLAEPVASSEPETEEADSVGEEIDRYMANLLKSDDEPETEPELDEPMPLSDYSYRELQTMAMDLGIPANQSADDLRAELRFLLDKEEEE